MTVQALCPSLAAGADSLPLASAAPPPQAGAAHSRFVQRVRRRYGDVLALLPADELNAHTLQAALGHVLARGLALDAALRVLRQLVLERLAVQDTEANAPLHTITHAMTALAELALEAASVQAQSELDALHGAPLCSDGQRVLWWIVGMGKLGARELNVSSDIDVVYVYGEDGHTAGASHGRNKLSNHEYFLRAVKRVHALVGEVTEHGHVFRMDLALRPHGNSGPAAVSLDALEAYFLCQGREWERFAWLKSRVVAPQSGKAHAAAHPLRAVVLPFVFRRHLDYNVFESLRELHQRIRDHASQRSAGHPERANDVKLARGGIREIEFTVQLLQVVRGGQFPELRTRSTLDALARLARAGLMAQPTAQALASAYEFLRRVEHRIQYLDDQQTHVLPTRDDDLAWLAHTMGLGGVPAFLTTLDAHREVVAQEFDALLGAGRACPTCPAPRVCGTGADAHAAQGAEQASGANNANAQSGAALPDDTHSPNSPNDPQWAALLAACDGPVRERLALWPQHPLVLGLGDAARGRMLRVLTRMVQWLAQGRTQAHAVLRMADWLEPLLRRDMYLALLLERPAVHERLLRLLGAARWPARYVLKHPGVIDELASRNLFETRFDAAEFEAELHTRRQALARTGQDDDEALLDLLRRAQHAEQLRTLARDVEGVLSVEQVADDLSALADTMLRVVAQWCWSRLKRRHRDSPQMAVIAYGKWGGQELGYGSDLDLVFVYDDSAEGAQEVYATYVRKIIHWMTVKTGEGDLYEIDTALRPNGNAGLLVTPLSAYADYQQQRGSNAAWTWEHQAMTRARCVLGPPEVIAGFDAVRQAVLTAPRHAPHLLAEIVAMRDKVRQAHPVPAGLFDVKHSAGGMVDVEFAVQYLVLLHAAAHPSLAANVGNMALLGRAQALGLLPAAVADAAASAYRQLRHVQHRARLNEEATARPSAELHTQRQAVLALWAQVMAAPTASA